MSKWVLLGFIIYLLYKSSGPIFSIFKVSQNIKEKNRKTDIHSKILKMDIQDAEFDEENNE
jgi:hypothetical protein